MDAHLVAGNSVRHLK